MEILKAVQATSDDAAVSKLSAKVKGYYEDDFIEIFVGKAAKRSPLINRGYYARVKAMDTVVQRFVSCAGARAQVVALGAGSDTTFFRLKKNNAAPAKYVEVDLRGVLLKKLKVLAEHEHVRKLAGVSLDDVDAVARGLPQAMLQSSDYALACVDLRDTQSLESVLRRVEGFDFGAPTLLVSECVLCYVDPLSSGKLLLWAREAFAAVAFVTYEQILPDDAFGRTMLGHFESRGCPLLAIRSFPDLDAQRNRFAALGFGQVEALDMNDVYYKCLDRDDLRRAERLEIFDEFEEWHLMQAHYCVVLAVNDTTGSEGCPGVLGSLRLQPRSTDESAPGAPGAPVRPVAVSSNGNAPTLS